MKSAIVSIGDELLSGDTVNTNASWIGKYLRSLGLHHKRVVTIADEVDTVYHELKKLGKEYQLIITTGGLGPTKDDKTKLAIQKLIGSEMVFNEDNFRHIQQMFERRGVPMTPLHREQCHFPEGVEVIDNEWGTAPGLWYTWNEATFISLPGVPYEMRHLLQEKVMPRLAALGLSPAWQYTFYTAGIGETSIYERIKHIEPRLPQGFMFAFLPSHGMVRLVLKAPHGTTHEDASPYLEEIRETLGDYVFSEDNPSLAEAVGRLLKQKNATLSLCESCTGGNVSKMVVDNPGSSAYFLGGFVSYSNDFKSDVVGVSTETIESHGAVSEPTVREMLEGSLRLSSADYGIAISGIAGPGGGTDEKPVGTFWLAYGKKDHIQTKKINVLKDRKINISYVSIFALNALRFFILND